MNSGLQDKRTTIRAIVKVLLEQPGGPVGLVQKRGQGIVEISFYPLRMKKIMSRGYISSLTSWRPRSRSSSRCFFSCRNCARVFFVRLLMGEMQAVPLWAEGSVVLVDEGLISQRNEERSTEAHYQKKEAMAPHVIRNVLYRIRIFGKK